MPPNYLTSGYVERPRPVTQIEAVTRRSSAHIKTIAKNAVLKHLRAYLDEDGKHRHLTQHLFPDAMKFVVDDFQRTDATEAQSKVRLPVYKFTSDIQSMLPCIVVNDSGITYKSAGLGFDQGNVRLGDKQVAQIITVLRTIQLNMLLASQDQSTTDSLVDIVSLVFGELFGVTNGMAVSGASEGETWIVRFPKVPELGSSERANIGDDGKDLLWTSLTSFTVEYEDSFLLPFTEPEYTIQAISEGCMPKRTMAFPTRVNVGRDVHGNVRYMRPGDVVVVGDPKIIRVRPGEHPEQYYVRGVRPGKTTIRVVNNNEFKGGAHAHVVDSVDIEVGY